MSSAQEGRLGLPGLMQDDFPLTLQHVLGRMRTFPDAGSVTTLTPDGTVRASFGECVGRIDRLARVLGELGIGRGDRVATFAFNTQRHFECYLAVPCMGAVLHTVNPRLFLEQVVYVINHAQDRVMLVDDLLAGVLAQIAHRLESVEHFILMGDGPDEGLPRVLRYEELLAAATPGPREYPPLDEREAAALCYTSGTTGDPKGVLYSHRSSTLHAAATLMTPSIGIAPSDRVLIVVPMFHVNAWGLPFAAALAGADIVMPGRHLDAESLARLIEQERCTVMACVPTLYADLLRHLDHSHEDLSSLRMAVCGGAAMPVALARAFEERHGVRMIHAWGMTETSPLATVARVDADGADEDAWKLRATQGRAVPFVELRVVNERGEIPWDGEATGEIEVRGPWIARAYYESEDDEGKFHDGWLRTGDIAHVEPGGWVQITDRAKDVIKSGGEWISSVELENQLMAHPAVREAAVIAVPHARWSERPLACVVLDDDQRVTAEGLRDFLRGRVANFWLPDEFAFVDEIPKTSVGKFDKKALRASLAEGSLEHRVTLR